MALKGEKNSKSKNWADEEDEDLEENDSGAHGSGVFERVSLHTNQKGQKVKTLSKIRVKEIRNKIPLRVFDRKNLPRFGEAKVGESNVTLPSPDFVSMEHPEDQLLEDNDDPALTKTLANFISKQQERGLAREFEIDEEKKGPLDVDVVLNPPSSTALYVAPGNRRREEGGGGAGGGGFGGDKDGTENTLRVSNLTKAVTEEDLRELFERFGRIHRVSLPRMERVVDNQIIKEPRGFAYIAFAKKEDAEMALTRLDGHGYDHLIIKVEWAKGGGGGGGDMSGYGKQLAQDTTEKVYNLQGGSK